MMRRQSFVRSTRQLAIFALSVLIIISQRVHGEVIKSPLQAGFAEIDATPKLDGATVYLAGFGKDRKAIGVHDPIMVRAVVLRDGKRKVALASVDLIGLFHESIQRVRKELPGFDYVLVSSTHNHEGPDTMGLWGPTLFQSGVDADYLKRVETSVVQAIRRAEKKLTRVVGKIGTTRAPKLLHDGREPYVKHDELVALQLQRPQSGKNIGLVVQWNCHPETLGSGNKLVSADFVPATVKYLGKQFECPVVYFTGTVGGLMTSLHVPIVDGKGEKLKDGTFAKTDRYGYLVGKVAERALKKGKSIKLTPFDIRSKVVFVPMDNKFYRLGWTIGTLDRQAFLWSGNPYKAKQAKQLTSAKSRLCLKTEVCFLGFGDLGVVGIPGEIYPELILGKVQDPVDPKADFPRAAIEPAVYDQLKTRYRMIIGLANDEIGYIIPKRQWDSKPPYCYGRKKSQYGEINSVGPDAAPVLCQTIRDLLRPKKN